MDTMQNDAVRQRATYQKSKGSGTANWRLGRDSGESRKGVRLGFNLHWGEHSYDTQPPGVSRENHGDPNFRLRLRARELPVVLLPLKRSAC